MTHEIHAVTAVEKVAPFTLRVHFEDGSVQTIDFHPVLAGEVFGPLSDSNVFDQVRLDNEGRTLVWPNGADFDRRPSTIGLKKARGSRLSPSAGRTPQSRRSSLGGHLAVICSHLAVIWGQVYNI